MDTVGGVGEIREDRLVTHLPTRPGALTKAARGLDRSGIVGFDRAQSNGEQATQKREAAQGAEYRATHQLRRAEVALEAGGGGGEEPRGRARPLPGVTGAGGDVHVAEEVAEVAVVDEGAPVEGGGGGALALRFQAHRIQSRSRLRIHTPGGPLRAGEHHLRQAKPIS
eukprot:1188205-Prorocentrum_minimum.AAC.9